VKISAVGLLEAATALLHEGVAAVVVWKQRSSIWVFLFVHVTPPHYSTALYLCSFEAQRTLIFGFGHDDEAGGSKGAASALSQCDALVCLQTYDCACYTSTRFHCSSSLQSSNRSAHSSLASGMRRRWAAAQEQPCAAADFMLFFAGFEPERIWLWR
jgi:hypothetical protein